MKRLITLASIVAFLIPAQALADKLTSVSRALPFHCFVYYWSANPEDAMSDVALPLLSEIIGGMKPEDVRAAIDEQKKLPTEVRQGMVKESTKVMGEKCRRVLKEALKSHPQN